MSAHRERKDTKATTVLRVCKVRRVSKAPKAFRVR